MAILFAERPPKRGLLDSDSIQEQCRRGDDRHKETDPISHSQTDTQEAEQDAGVRGVTDIPIQTGLNQFVITLNRDVHRKQASQRHYSGPPNDNAYAEHCPTDREDL